jgi:hypothetical protein
LRGVHGGRRSRPGSTEDIAVARGPRRTSQSCTRPVLFRGPRRVACLGQRGGLAAGVGSPFGERIPLVHVAGACARGRSRSGSEPTPLPETSALISGAPVLAGISVLPGPCSPASASCEDRAPQRPRLAGTVLAGIRVLPGPCSPASASCEDRARQHPRGAAGSLCPSNRSCSLARGPGDQGPGRVGTGELAAGSRERP